MSRIAEKVPGWVERLLIPTLESRVRAIIKEAFEHSEKVTETRFEAMNDKIDGIEKEIGAVEKEIGAVEKEIGAVEKEMKSGFEAVNAKIDSLEKRLPLIEDLAEIKARLAEVERRTTARPA